MIRSFVFDQNKRLPSAWNPTRMLVRGKLTDRKIAKYAKEGYYSAEYRTARRELMARKAVKAREAMARRDGSFLVRDGRLIYNPL